MKKPRIKSSHIKRTLKKDIPLPKKIGIDILGGLLILGSILFGWLPGPGGIPLFLAGLSLLATNHDWAHRLLESIKANGNRIGDFVFRDHKLLSLTYDAISTIFIVVAGIVLGQASGNIIRGLFMAVLFLGIALFLGNRKRLQRLNRQVKKIIRRNS